jgi:predicted ATP-grasp superfamily ATP-dependent carboligase
VSASVLLLSSATHWFAQARMPSCLARAGFEVSVLAPRGSLAEKSRFVKNIGPIAENTTATQWTQAFAEMVNATSPDLVLPCDDTSFRLMQMLVYSPPAHLAPAQRRDLVAAVTASLGNPAFYRMSVDKTLLSPAAERLGVRVPPHRLVAEPREAEAFAAEHGYPVVLKRGHSTAGEGVAICSDPAQIAQAFDTLTQGDPTGIPDTQGARLLAQAHIPGKIQYYAGVAWKGELVSGMAVEKLAGEPKGPSSVSRYFRSDELRDFSARIARGFEIFGIFAPEFAIDARTGEAYLLELNRRMTHGTHRGAAMDVDAGAALFAAVTGTPATTRADLDEGEEHLCVHFPQEWVRDPESHWLTDHPVDVPWDEPELLEAMVALRRVL